MKDRNHAYVVQGAELERLRAALWSAYKFTLSQTDTVERNRALVLAERFSAASHAIIVGPDHV